MIASLKKMYFIYLFLCISIDRNDGQRLSQGASDWYMRFHSNFRHVKRDVDPPEIKSFLVSSTINVSICITVSKLLALIFLHGKYLSELIEDVFYILAPILYNRSKNCYCKPCRGRSRLSIWFCDGKNSVDIKHNVIKLNWNHYQINSRC